MALCASCDIRLASKPGALPQGSSQPMSHFAFFVVVCRIYLKFDITLSALVYIVFLESRFLNLHSRGGEYKVSTIQRLRLMLKNTGNPLWL